MGNVAVYKKGTTDFFSQGLGLLPDVVSSNLTQTVSSTGNVEQKLEVEYPIDGYLVSELVEGAILRVSVSTDKSDYGVFEIVDTLKDDSGTITVYGDPYYNRILRMSFDNGGVFTKFSNVQSALNAAKQNITGFPTNFNLISNLSTSVDLSANTYDTFGTFLEALNSAAHGNIKYSLNSIQIYSALGKDITDITLRDDMNTSSVKITTDFSGIINKVIPVLPVLDKDGNATDQTKVGTIVTSKYSNQFLDYWAGKVIQFDTQDLANTYFDRTNADRPVQTVDVDPIGLDDDFSTINIFDTIELYSTRLDYTDKLRVSERVFDTLSENVTSFKLGSSSVNIFNQINEQNNEIFNNVVKLTNAAISANGKGIDYFGQAQPSSPKEGDTWFWDDGTDFGIKQYTNGEWVDLAGSNTAEKIAAAVTDAVTQANAHTDEVKQSLSSDIATAKSQAASQASAAEANAKSASTSQFTQAQSALSAAKSDLTNSIASEASARNVAVAAANSQAQTYANQAKADAMSAASSADGVIRTAISSSANSLSATITQNKSSADSGISTAQTTAKAAVDGLALKVSKTDYDQKTGDLSTKINDVKQTADSSAQTIADIKTADGKQDFRISEVEKTAGEIKSTVSDISTEQGKQSGYISTLKQRADGFDATVTKVDNLSIGGRNYYQIVNSVVGYIGTDGVIIASSSLGVKTSDYISVTTGDTWQLTYWPSDATNRRMLYAMYNTSGSLVGSRVAVDVPTTKDSSTVSLVIPSGVAKIRVGAQYMADDSSKIKIELGTVATDWTPAPEDVDSATAKVKLTADEASAAISKLTSADGIITKAQADIKANADAITQKVSKTIYDQNNGNLTQAISKAQSTADGVVTTVGNYQTSNDARVKAAESKIEQNSKDITAKVSQTDYDNNNSKLNERFTKVEYTADGAATTVSDLQTDLKGMSYENRNLLENSGFEFPVNNITGTFSVVDGSNTTRPTPFDTKMGLIDNVANQVADDVWGWYPLNTAVTLKANVTYTLSYYFSVAGKAGYQHSDYGVDDSGNFIKGIMAEHETPDTTGGQMVWKRYSKTFTLETDTVLAGLRFGFVSNVDGRGWKVVDNVKLEIGSKATDHSVAPNDTTLSISQVSQKADSISNFVRDSSGNISSDFQTALSKTSIITGSTLATSIKTQTSSQITSALTDNNGKIISLINQDTSGVQIAGKNLAITADTTVDGNFWAKQVNAVKVNATNITAGTLNASDVNIINLDVNSLTGNVSNFIQSHWNGEFGSVSIDPFGMRVSTFGVTTEFNSLGMSLKYANELAGGIGVNHWDGMSDTFQGLYFGLSGKGDFMSFGARNTGVETGVYTSKLAWMRNEWKAPGMNSGWTFMDNVTFENDLVPKGGSNQKMILGTSTFNNNAYPYFGDSRNNAGLAYGSSQVYLISDNTFYNLTSVIKAFSGIGAIKIPKEIRSDGTIASWSSISI